MKLTNINKNFNRFLESKIKIDLSSFKLKDKLNPDLWDESDNIKSDMSQILKDIARDFTDELKFDRNWIKDIVITGSLANYNWSKYSDIDLHVIVDFRNLDKNTSLVKKFLDAVRVNWNKEHDILIKDHEVEIYIQDHREKHVSAGMYSLIYNQWIKKPSKKQPYVNNTDVKLKSQVIIDQINEVMELYDSKKYHEAYQFALVLKEKIKNMRKCGLEKGGEFSIENLTFKTLRNTDYLDKLYKLVNNAYDQNMSVRENINIRALRTKKRLN